MSQIPVHDRPRERFARKGGEALGDRELLALLLGTGGSPGVGAHELAERLLDRFGSVAAIAKATIPEMCSVKGIGAAKASSVAAGFELARRASLDSPSHVRSTSDIAMIAGATLRGLTRERLVVISCDIGSRVLGIDPISEGAVDQTLFPVREVLVAVLRRDGRAFAIAHNHPSGDPTPSAHDVQATRMIEEAARTAGLRLLGHIVVAETSWHSVTTCR